MPVRLTSMGVDLASSATGLVMLDERDAGPPGLVFAKEIAFPNLAGMARYRAIVTVIIEHFYEHKPDVLVVEGYSLNTKNVSSIVPLIEVGGLLRFMLHLDDIAWFDPRASELKKFVTGKGNSPKEVVMMNVFKRWGFEAQTNNIADAFVLAAMGLAAYDRLRGVSLDMRKIAGAMTKRKA